MSLYWNNPDLGRTTDWPFRLPVETKGLGPPSRLVETVLLSEIPLVRLYRRVASLIDRSVCTLLPKALIRPEIFKGLLKVPSVVTLLFSADSTVRWRSARA